MGNTSSSGAISDDVTPSVLASNVILPSIAADLPASIAKASPAWGRTIIPPPPPVRTSTPPSSSSPRLSEETGVWRWRRYPAAPLVLANVSFLKDPCSLHVVTKGIMSEVDAHALRQMSIYEKVISLSHTLMQTVTYPNGLYEDIYSVEEEMVGWKRKVMETTKAYSAIVSERDDLKKVEVDLQRVVARLTFELDAATAK